MKRIVLALVVFAGVALATSSAFADHRHTRSYVGRGGYGCASRAAIGYNVYRDPYLYTNSTYRFPYGSSVYYDRHHGYFNDYYYHNHGGIAVQTPRFSVRFGY
jgi:hypothetical protein